MDQGPALCSRTSGRTNLNRNGLNFLRKGTPSMKVRFAKPLQLLDTVDVAAVEEPSEQTNAWPRGGESLVNGSGTHPRHHSGHA